MNKRIPIKSVVLAGCTVICIALLLYSLYRALTIYIPQKQEQSRFVELRQIVAQEQSEFHAESDDDDLAEGDNQADNDASVASPYTVLTSYNSDCVGWLRIDDTVIDYPVMKSSEEDPEYYLHRDFDKNYSFSGSLFIGEGCDAESDVFVIYGHNMNNGSMFGSLRSFGSDSFTEAHKEIIFDTLNGRRVYRIFAAFVASVSENADDNFKYYDSVGDLNSKEYFNMIEEIKKLSVIHAEDTPEYPQQIVFLSTCDNMTDNGRFVVAAYRVQ